MNVCNGEGLRAVFVRLPAEGGFAESVDLSHYEPCDCPACVGIAAKREAKEKSAAGTGIPNGAVENPQDEDPFPF